MNGFLIELESLINKYTMENTSKTPDFILAMYMYNCLKAYDAAVQQREDWYGIKPNLFTDTSLNKKPLSHIPQRQTQTQKK